MPKKAKRCGKSRACGCLFARKATHVSTMVEPIRRQSGRVTGEERSLVSLPRPSQPAGANVSGLVSPSWLSGGLGGLTLVYCGIFYWSSLNDCPSRMRCTVWTQQSCPRRWPCACFVVPRPPCPCADPHSRPCSTRNDIAVRRCSFALLSSHWLAPRSELCAYQVYAGVMDVEDARQCQRRRQASLGYTITLSIPGLTCGTPRLTRRLEPCSLQRISRPNYLRLREPG
jgi:hypothetical protein